MKKALLILFIFHCSLIFADEKAKDPGGYNDLKWGDSYETVNTKYSIVITNDDNFNKKINITSNTNFSVYVNIDQKSNFVKYRYFVFYKEQLIKVYIIFHIKVDNYTENELINAIIKKTTEKHGKPNKEDIEEDDEDEEKNQTHKYTIWDFPSTLIKLDLTYFKNGENLNEIGVLYEMKNFTIEKEEIDF